MCGNGFGHGNAQTSRGYGQNQGMKGKNQRKKPHSLAAQPCGIVGTEQKVKGFGNYSRYCQPCGTAKKILFGQKNHLFVNVYSQRGGSYSGLFALKKFFTLFRMTTLYVQGRFVNRPPD